MEDGAVAFKHQDFINHDARRFQVRVTDPTNNAASVTVRLSTHGKSHSQPARELTLPRVSPEGVFESTNLLLVADAEDTFVEPPEVVAGTRDTLYHYFV